MLAPPCLSPRHNCTPPQVVVAVLLDEFISSVQREKDAAERLEIEERNKKKIRGFLDPMTGALFVCV